jgi:ABC-2 type transport system ATP-binding protein
MDAVVMRGLTRRYGRRRGVDDVDLAVPEGAIYGFLGPNGAGKTTTIRLLLGFLRPTSGSALVLGRDAWRDSAAIKRDVGYVPGDLRLYPWMSARSALAVVAAIRGCDLAAPSAALLERFELDPHVRVEEMSRGMRQKLGLVLALAPDPRLLVLDEPTSGLDPLMQDALLVLLRERAAHGRTVFFSSHTLREVEELCERVAIVRRGRVVADESLAALRARAAREVVLRFESAAAAERTRPPAGLSVRERTGVTWRAELAGAPQPLFEWLRGAGIADLTLGPPDLATLFRAYYQDDEVSR